MNRNEHDLAVGEQESMAINGTSIGTSSKQQRITPELFAATQQATALPPPQEKTPPKDLQVHVLSPVMAESNACSIPLPKGELVLLLQGEGVTALDQEALTLTYHKREAERGNHLVTQTLSYPLQPLLQEHTEGGYTVTIPLDFAQQIPDLEAKDFLKIDLLQQPKMQIAYRPSDKVGVEDPEAVTASKERVEKYRVNTFFKEEHLSTLQAYLPELTLQRTSKGDAFVKTATLQTLLQAKEQPVLAEAALEALSAEELVQQTQLYQEQAAVLQKIAYKFDYLTYPYEQLKSNYEGENADTLFDEAYQTQVAENRVTKMVFGQNILALQSLQQQVAVVLEQKSIPEELKEIAAALENQKIAVSQRFELLEADMNAISVLPLNFADWSKNIKELEQVPTESAAAFIAARSAYMEAIKAYEKANPTATQNEFYKTWRTQKAQLALSFQKDMNESVERFTAFVQQKKIPLAATGGDGRLEYRSGENQVSAAEQARFGDQNGANVVFRSPTVPLFQNGISPEDVQQGGVGDCYLMAAMMLLAEDDTKHWIEEMIVEKEDRYIVTLYSNDMPVEVEVDKQTLWLEFIDGGEGDLGANTQRELWPAVIEKAYAKLQTNIPPLKEQLAMAKAGNMDTLLPLQPEDYGGDYTQIEGEQTSVAMRALGGNRLSKDETIYLDEAGQISETATPSAFPTRLEFKNTTVSEADLAALLQATQSAGYKISVDSPETMSEVKGLTDDHLIEISAGVFMKFKHSYVVGGADAQGVQLLDPHQKTKNEETKLYNPDVFTFVKELKIQLETLQSELKSSDYDGFSMKTSDNLEIAFDNLKEIGGKTALNNLRTNWNRLKTRKEIVKENGQVTGLRSKSAKNILEELTKYSELLSQEDIGKGFEILRDKEIEGKQDIKYITLKNYFEAIRINKIRK